jgi:peptidase YpeB-like protein
MGRPYVVALIVCWLAGSILAVNAQDKHMPGSPGLAPVVPRDPVQAEAEKTARAANTARITLVQAIKTAQQKVAGNPIEATLSAEEGRPVYKVTILDGTGRLQILLIDGIEGKIVEKPK